MSEDIEDIKDIKDKGKDVEDKDDEDLDNHTLISIMRRMCRAQEYHSNMGRALFSSLDEHLFYYRRGKGAMPLFDRNECTRQLHVQRARIDKQLSVQMHVCPVLLDAPCSLEKHHVAYAEPTDMKTLIMLCAKMSQYHAGASLAIFIMVQRNIKLTPKETSQFVTEGLWSNLVALAIMKKRINQCKKAYKAILKEMQPNLQKRADNMVSFVSKLHSEVWCGNPDLLHELVRLLVYQNIHLMIESCRMRNEDLLSANRVLYRKFTSKNLTENTEEGSDQLLDALRAIHRGRIDRNYELSLIFPKTWETVRPIRSSLCIEPTSIHCERIKQRILTQGLPSAWTYPFSNCIVWKAIADHFPNDVERLRDVFTRDI